MMNLEKKSDGDGTMPVRIVTSEPLVANAPATRVVVLEDRAHVSRHGEVDLPAAGLARILVTGVSPVLADKTLSALLTGDAGPAQINFLRVVRRRRVVAAERPEEIAQLERQLEECDAQARLERDAKSILERQQRAVAELQDQTRDDIAADTAWGKAPAEQTAELFTSLARDETDVREQIVRKDFRIAELEERWRDLRKLIDSRRQPAVETAAEILIDVDARAPGTHRLSVTYVVPGACWRPAHAVQLAAADDAAGSVAIESDACIWQNTGEDWTGVLLSLSTQRSSLGTEPPTLATDAVSVRKKWTGTDVAVREEVVQTIGKEQTTVRRGRELPGIDDGGTPYSLQSPTPATIPSDGRPYRIRLFSFASPAILSRVCMPELAACAYVKSEQTNHSEQAMLAGPVDLVRRSGFVGRTKTLFVSPGGRFELNWGPDPTIRVYRETAEVDQDKALLSSWVSRLHTVTVYVSNIGAEPRSLEVVERVPISEIEKVKVEIDAGASSDGAVADASGFVRWAIRLAPFGREKLQLRYVVKRHKEVQGI